MSQEGFDGCIPIVLVPIEKGVDSPVVHTRQRPCNAIVAKSTNKNKAMRAKKFLVPNLPSEIENKNGDKSGSNRRGTKTPMTK